MDPAAMRISYERGTLDEATAADDPLQQFGTWFDEAVASEVLELNCMTLATVGTDGRPSTRVVLIKGYDAEGIVFYTNYDSRKGAELAANPFAALQFHWVQLQRVVRIEGRVEKVSPEESDEYYASRPLGSRWGAWISPQSRVLPSRDVLDAAEANAAQRYGDDPARPPNWGGYRLVPDAWEFWQGRPSRLHDRLRYRLEDGRWRRERLAP